MSPLVREIGISCLLLAVPIAVFWSNVGDERATSSEAVAPATVPPAVGLAVRVPDRPADMAPISAPSARTASIANVHASPSSVNVLMAVPRVVGSPTRERRGTAPENAN